MLECSTRVMDMLVAQLELGQLNPGRLGAGLELSNPSGFIDWHNFDTLCQRANEAAGGYQRLDELTGSTFNAALPEGVPLMTLAGDPAAGLGLMNAFANATFFTHLRYGMKRTGERTFRISAKFQRARESGVSRAFFHAVAGNLRSATRFAGLPHSTVRTSFHAAGADYELTLPQLPPPASDDAARRTRRLFLQNCRRELASSRALFVEAQRTAKLAAVSATYASLATVTAQALVGEQRHLMPNAAVRAIAGALGCQRIAISRWENGARERRLVAELGDPATRVTSIEVETLNGLLVVQASVPRSSREEAALQKLGPWLALIFDQGPPPSAPRTDDWQATRLAELSDRWRLTPRQGQVALLMAQGETNKSIGVTLGCAEGTVELHARAIMQKAALPSRAALAAYFFSGR